MVAAHEVRHRRLGESWNSFRLHDTLGLVPTVENEQAHYAALS